MSQTQDFLSECNVENLPAHQFMAVWCQKCRNSACRNANWGLSRWIARMNTQEDRLLNNPNFAHADDPQYQHIREIDFPDLLNQAIRLEIAGKNNDWEVPSQEDVKVHLASINPINMTNGTMESVDDATKALARAKGNPEPNLPSIVEKVTGDEGGVPTEPSLETSQPPQDTSQLPQYTPPLTPDPGTPARFLTNTPCPPDGIMLGGATVPPPSEVEDPWAPPSIKDKKVNVGATIKLGTDKGGSNG